MINLGWREIFILTICIICIILCMYVLFSPKITYKKFPIQLELAILLGLFLILCSIAYIEHSRICHEIVLADRMVERGEYRDAMMIYDRYKDIGNLHTEEKMKDIYDEYIYQEAIIAESRRDYVSALECYIKIFGYKDTEERYEICQKLNLMKEEEIK